MAAPPGPMPGPAQMPQGALPPEDPRAALSPEQAQIVQIVLADPLILNAIAQEISGGAAPPENPALSQAALASAQMPAAAETANPLDIERALLGG